MPIDPGTHLRKIAKVIGCARNQLLTGLRDRLAAIVGFGQRNLRNISRDQSA